MERDLKLRGHAVLLLGLFLLSILLASCTRIPRPEEAPTERETVTEVPTETERETVTEVPTETERGTDTDGPDAGTDAGGFPNEFGDDCTKRY